MNDLLIRYVYDTFCVVINVMYRVEVLRMLDHPLILCNTREELTPINILTVYFLTGFVIKEFRKFLLMLIMLQSTYTVYKTPHYPSFMVFCFSHTFWCTVRGWNIRNDTEWLSGVYKIRVFIVLVCTFYDKTVIMSTSLSLPAFFRLKL